MKTNDRSKHTGLSNLSRKSIDVAKYYDDWASDYDRSLADWRYDAPDKIASIVRANLAQESRILDAGCGTGLCGKALVTSGFTSIDGIDVSQRSLEVARGTNAYESLRAIDMQALPLPISDDQYDGLACVGVLTYLSDSVGTLREFSRVVKPGGIVAITQRNDLFAERSFPDILSELVNEGVIARVHTSEPLSYLPENEEFTDQILVRYVDYTVV